MEQKTLAIDFDGTCVTHAFPEIGVEIGAPLVLKKLVNQGHKLILYTMRSNKKDFIVTPVEKQEPGIVYAEGQFLTAAIKWFENHGIPLYGVNINPTQMNWTTSPKAYADYYIDDAAVGAPLKFDKAKSDRPFMDWYHMEFMLIRLGLLPQTKFSIMWHIISELKGTHRWESSILKFNDKSIKEYTFTDFAAMSDEQVMLFHAEIIIKHFVNLT